MPAPLSSLLPFTGASLLHGAPQLAQNSLHSQDLTVFRCQNNGGLQMRHLRRELASGQVGVHKFIQLQKGPHLAARGPGLCIRCGATRPGHQSLLQSSFFGACVAPFTSPLPEADGLDVATVVTIKTFTGQMDGNPAGCRVQTEQVPEERSEEGAESGTVAPSADQSGDLKKQEKWLNDALIN
ncbi:hypothetical protein WMY93_009747 [Mugilogobius chulae]|uniref:Uncharacterized protein n=1 Tax=Mugilogobius chulae TaxID=88201 RepID=A0AAW0PLB9_9GOBI